MITITTEELDQYEQLGSGKYGIVYQINDEIAYKIYKETIMGKDGLPIMNPSLCTSRQRLSRQLALSKVLKYTDLIQDIIIVDGYFGGVSIPYYPGCTLETFRYSNYELKKDISRQLIRNNQELKEHYIYPMDYHPGNIMVVNNNAKIIDLDDSLTRFCRIPNPFFQKISQRRLNETIQDIFGEYDISLYGKTLTKDLKRKRSKYTAKNNWLEDFFEEKEQVKDYLLIHEYSNLEEVKELLRNHQFRVIFILEEKEDIDWLYRTIEDLKQEGIHLFDFVLKEKMNFYFLNFPCENKVLVDEDVKVLTK